MPKICLWDNNKLQTATNFSGELIVTLWTRSFTVRVTESGPKSRDYSIPPLESEKVMLPYSRLNFSKMGMELTFGLTVSSNRKLSELFHEWKDICLLWYRFGCCWLWLAEKHLRKTRWFFIYVIMTRLFDKAICTVTAKHRKCGFLILIRHVHNMADCFTLKKIVRVFIISFLCMNIEILMSLEIPSRTKDSSTNN